MNKNNYIFYAIIIYIIIISLLIITKPNLIYNHQDNKFKRFGYTEDKSMFPISILSILIAVILTVILSLSAHSDNNHDYYQNGKINNHHITTGELNNQYAMQNRLIPQYSNIGGNLNQHILGGNPNQYISGINPNQYISGINQNHHISGINPNQHMMSGGLLNSYIIPNELRNQNMMNNIDITDPNIKLPSYNQPIAKSFVDSSSQTIPFQQNYNIPQNNHTFLPPPI
jgi:hypothetical protein